MLVFRGVYESTTNLQYIEFEFGETLWVFLNSLSETIVEVSVVLEGIGSLMVCLG